MKELETNSKTKKISDFFDIKNGNIEISWHFQPFRMLKKKKGNLSGIAYGQKVLGEVSWHGKLKFQGTGDDLTFRSNCEITV